MSINLLMDIGSSALTAQRIALEVTGENVTNVNTPGYSRQSAVLTPGVSTVVNGLTLGGGVAVDTIQRSYDSFLQGQLADANAASGQASTSSSTMQQIQPLFNDLTTSGLGSSLQDFFSAWQDLSANPQGVPERQAVLSKGQELVDDFHRISGSLGDIKANMNQSLVGWTSDVNDSLKQVASLNAQIKEVEAVGGQANEIRDQRDLLIRDLSQKVGIKSTEQSDGTLTVTLPYPNGQTLVSENTAATFSLQTNATSGNSDVILTPVGGAASNVTSFIGGPDNSRGAIGAMLEIRDTVVDQYQGKLDELASTLAAQVNSVHAAGYGLPTTANPTGTTGLDFFAVPSGTTGAAANIQLNVSSASDIAASDSDTSVGGTGNNKNAQNIANIYNASIAMTGGNQTLGDFYTGLVGQVGVDVQNAGRADTQTAATLTQLNNLRESQSGVSLDEELTNLTKYQMAYQGAAKLITVGTQMMDTVLGLIQ
jgi:flagellar hook-associated protein 1